MGQELGPSEKRELDEQQEHLRSIYNSFVSGCPCPICLGKMWLSPTKAIVNCDKSERHWITVKELAELSFDECIALLHKRHMLWVCPQCKVEVFGVGEMGKCPDCGFYTHPDWYGRRRE